MRSNTRIVRRTVAALFTGALLLAAAVTGLEEGSPTHPSLAAAQAGGDRTNFVVIVTDDLSKRMFRASRSLRRGSESAGIEFLNAFAPTPLCCPARSTLLTGRYVHHHGVRQNYYATRGIKLYGSERRFRERALERQTIAYLLRRQGYATSLMGVYLNGYGDNDGGPSGRDPEAPPDEPGEDGSFRTRVPPGWSDWHAFAGWGINDNGRYRCFGWPLCLRGEPTADGQHLTDQLIRRAIPFLEAHRGQGNPFFLYLAPHQPHNEHPPANRYAHTHDRTKLPKSASFNEEDTSDKPGYIARDEKLAPAGARPEGCSPNEWPIAWPTPDSRCWRSEDYSRHAWENGLESLESVNELYDRVIAKLAAIGELDNTYIVLVSDNGVHLGEHRQPYGKNTPYAEDVGVPLVVRGPGIRHGRNLHHLVGLQDIAPTILHLASASVPAGMDGRSLRPLLRASPPAPSAWRERLLIEGYRGSKVDLPRPASHDTPEWHGEVTRDGRKYVEYATGERELYRLIQDPQELENGVPDAPEGELTALARELAALRKCVGASACRAAEDR